MSLADFAFQACTLNRSVISPFRVTHLRILDRAEGDLCPGLCPNLLGVSTHFKLNIQKRLQQLEFEEGKKLTLLATVEGGPWLERKYHQQFATYRLRGEWFTLSPKIAALIKTLREPVAV